MSIKAILLDFDGTALQKDQDFLSVRNMYAIKKALALGVAVIPCTGRVEDMFPPQIEKEKAIRYWVTSNGARVVDRNTGEVIYSDCFTPEQSAELCKIFEKKQIYCEIAAEGKIYLEREVGEHLEKYAVPPHHVWFVEENRQVLIKNCSEYFLANQIGVEKFNLYNVPKEEQKSMLKQFNNTDIVQITDGAGRDIQIFPKCHDRNKSVKALFNYLNISFDEVMSIGDSELDVPVIESAKIGVVMENAPQWVKDRADYVTDSNVNDGVAKAIEKFILKEN